jgi:hypothetical protein
MHTSIERAYRQNSSIKLLGKTNDVDWPKCHNTLGGKMMDFKSLTFSAKASARQGYRK